MGNRNSFAGRRASEGAAQGSIDHYEFSTLDDSEGIGVRKGVRDVAGACPAWPGRQELCSTTVLHGFHSVLTTWRFLCPDE